MVGWMKNWDRGIDEVLEKTFYPLPPSPSEQKAPSPQVTKHKKARKEGTAGPKKSHFAG